MAGKSVESELSRDLTLFHITMMGLGMMIPATKIFELPMLFQSEFPMSTVVRPLKHLWC